MNPNERRPSKKLVDELRQEIAKQQVAIGWLRETVFTLAAVLKDIRSTAQGGLLDARHRMEDERLEGDC